MARRIVIAGLKGGCGRTTVAVNLSSALALRGKKILLVDMDPQAGASVSLGVVAGEGEPSVYDLLLGLEETFAKAVYPAAVEGLHVVPSTAALCGAELELSEEPERQWRLSRLLDLLDEGYDYVFVDTPSSFGLLTLNSLVACREVLAPVAPGPLHIMAVERLEEVVGQVNSELGTQVDIRGIIPNMVDKRTGPSGTAIKKLVARFGSGLVRSRIRLDAKLSDAPSSGAPIQLFSPKSNSAYDFEVLADDVMVL